MDLTLSGLGPPDPFVDGYISSNVTWRWRLWKTLVPTVVKDEAFKRWNPSSNFSRALETGLLPQVVAQIWIKTSLSPTCRAETVGNYVPVSGTLVPSSWAVITVTSPGFEETLDIFNTISSFLCMSPSTCFCCSGMYFNTREMVAGMLNFFCNASILCYKHNSYKGTSLRPPLHNGLAVTQVKRKGGKKKKERGGNYGCNGLRVIVLHTVGSIPGSMDLREEYKRFIFFLRYRSLALWVFFFTVKISCLECLESPMGTCGGKEESWRNEQGKSVTVISAKAMKESSMAQSGRCSWPIWSSDRNPNDEKNGGESAIIVISGGESSDFFFSFLFSFDQQDDC